MKYGKGLVLLAIMAASGGTTFGVPPKSEQPENEKQSEASVTKSIEERPSWRIGDQFLASSIAIDNHEQVALSEWAQSRLQNAEAKEFGNMLVKDHTAFLKKLQKYAPEATQDNFLTATSISSQEVGTRGPADPRKPVVRREERRRERAENKGKPDLTDDQKPTNPVEQALRTGKGPIQQVAATSEITETSSLQVDLMQLHREMAEQCLADTQQLLSEKSEQEFDACFIGLQIARHASMKAKLTVCERHATGELKDLLSQARETTSEHLEHAQKLMKDLAPQATTAATKD